MTRHDRLAAVRRKEIAPIQTRHAWSQRHVPIVN